MRISARESGFLEPVSRFPLEWGFRRLAALGYDGVELRVVPDRLAWGPRARTRGIWHTEYDDRGRASLRRLADDLALEIPSLACDWASGYSEYCDDLARWDGVALELFRHHIDLAADVGARVVLIHFGMARGTWDDVKSLLTQIAEHAERRDVVVGVEDNIWHRTGLGDRDELRALVRNIGNRSLGVYVHLSGDVDDQARIVAASRGVICGLHSGELDEATDYRPVLDALQDVEYDGHWCFEVSGASIDASIRLARRLLQPAPAR